MGELTLIKRNGETIPLFSQEPFCTVKAAQQSVSLMGDDTVTLDIVSSELITFDKGDKIIVDGDEYSIRTTVNREKVSDNHYNYKPVFYGVIYELMKTLYRNTDVNGRSDKSVFTLTYTMKDFMRVLIYNLERDYHGIWQFDVANCPDTEAKTISFNRQNCLKTLQDLCSKENFNLDFQITQDNGVRTIHIGKFGALVNPPGGGDFFEWGKGNGVYTLKEEKVDDKTIKTRLWVEGGIKNIRSEYRDYAGALQLPYPKRLNAHAHTLRDGTVVEAGTEMIGIDDDTKRYLEDAELAAMLGTDEDANSYDDIYPKRTGEVTALAYKTDKQTGQQVLDVNSFIDSTMDFDLAETDASGNTKYLIAGVSAKITFISGKLSGQEFELELKNGYNHSERKFTLIPFQDERGLVTPTVDTDAFRIGVGDQYKITDIHLPKAYEDAAEEDLWYEAIQDFNEIRQAKAKYSLEFDRIYFMENTTSDATACIFKVGDYAPVRDKRFGIEKSIRITNVQRNLLVRQDYNITLSDTWAIAVATQAVIDVGRHETIINASGIKDLTRAKRGWRTTEELRNMIYDTDGYFDPEHIRPLSIDTNMLTVGSKSQQFILTGAILEANKNGNPNVFAASSCVLSHLTIQEEGVRNWNISAQDFTLAESGGYYLFAKCSKSGNNGTWYLTQEQLKAEETSDPNNYYFQVGVLGSCYQDDAFRDFVTTYGFTRINGNTITTGKIVTSDGYCYLDLDGNAFRIGDAHSSIDWNVTARGQLTLRNVRLLSDSGDTSEIGVYRGEYNPDYIYYKGDEVSYTDGGQTCTYRYKNPNPSKGHLPTNSTYWEILARGAAGETGNSIFYTFNDSLEKPAVPTGSGNTGGWHTNSTDAVVWMSIKSAKVISEGSWGTPFKVKGADGTSIVPKGYKNSVADLPTTGNSPGDCYFVNGYMYVWDGLTWINNGKIKGDPGTSSYLHLKYSNDGGKHFTDGHGDVPGRWIGMYVDQSVTDSDNPADYSWRDAQGEQGIPGVDGEDGRTTYLHIKYSNNGGLSFTDHNGEDPGAYIGQYTDFEEMDSSDPTMYKWSRLTGTAGAAGADSAAGDYYEYRYAKNGSTVAPPELNPNDPDPYGWTKTMPQVGALEYLWCTMCRKSALVDRTRVDIPVSNVDGLHDFSGNHYDGYIGSNTIVTDGDHDALQMTGQNDSRIPYDLPFGESFTLCLFMKVTTTPVKWIICGYNGADYVEKTLNLNANNWYHLAFRFNDTTCTLFINGEQSDISVVSERLVGFSVYDDNMFGSTTLIRGVRILKGALAQSDIVAVLTGSIDQILQPWSTPFRINPYDGKDGVEGKSPALVFRGNYNASGSVTYYGTSHRVDAVKYNGVYYVASVDAGTFNTVPTDTSKWNPFGAQFESIATNLLLAENANIAGWVFRNNRLESQNGSMYMDGVNGSVRLGGTLLMSTGFGGHENLEDFNIFYLQGVSKTTTIVVNSGVEHIGKVIKIFNTGTFSQGDYKICLTNFSVEEDESGSITSIGTNYEAVLRPQEVLEATCFRVPSSGNAVKGSWEITSRFSQTDFKADSGVIGRYALILGIGRYSAHSGGLTGTWWDGHNISSKLSVSKLYDGAFKIYFKESDIPYGSKFMVCGFGGIDGVGAGNGVFANVYNESFNGNNSFVEIHTADDSSLNDGGFEFTIFGTKWNYKLYD